MKSRILVTSSVVLFIFLSAYMVGCSQKVTFSKSAVVPAAKIEASIKQDANDNYAIDVKIKNLAPPKALTPSKQTYVVWVEHQNGFSNVGQVKLNKNMGGTLETLTPFQPISLKVTAENDPAVTSPGDLTVLESSGIELK